MDTQPMDVETQVDGTTTSKRLTIIAGVCLLVLEVAMLAWLVATGVFPALFAAVVFTTALVFAGLAAGITRVIRHVFRGAAGTTDKNRSRDQ